jgi:hypothetical protein
LEQSDEPGSIRPCLIITTFEGSDRFTKERLAKNRPSGQRIAVVAFTEPSPALELPEWLLRRWVVRPDIEKTAQFRGEALREHFATDQPPAS